MHTKLVLVNNRKIFKNQFLPIIGKISPIIVNKPPIEIGEKAPIYLRLCNGQYDCQNVGEKSPIISDCAKPPIPLLKNWQKIDSYLVCAEIANISSKKSPIVLKF